MAEKVSKNRRTQTPQADDFKSVASRLGCDDDKERFEARLAKIVHPGKVAKPKRRKK